MKKNKNRRWHKVTKDTVRHGIHNEKEMAGYTLADGTPLVEWLTISTDKGKLYLHMNDYADMLCGRRDDCRAYCPDHKKRHFALYGVAAWGALDGIAQNMQFFELNMGQTPLYPPRGATPCVDEHGDMVGWYDKNAAV